MIKQLFQLVTAIAGGIAIAVPSMVSANENVMMLSKNSNNWTMWGKTYDGNRYSPLKQINKDNVRDLRVAWTFSTGDPGKGETNTNSPIVVHDIEIGGEVLVHFDRSGFAYTLDREGKPLMTKKYDPAVNWATHIDMEPERPQVVTQYSTDQQGEDINTQSICFAALGSKDQQPATFSPRTGLFYVPTNHVCMDYEPFLVEYVAGQPYVGAPLSMLPAGRVMNDGTDHLGNFIAWDAAKGEIVWSLPEPSPVWSDALATGGNMVFYGTLDGYLKAVDANTGAELYSFKTPSGTTGNVNTWTHNGKQYVGVLSGIGMAAGLEGDTDGLGAVGAYRGLSKHTQLGGVLTVLAIPE